MRSLVALRALIVALVSSGILFLDGMFKVFYDDKEYLFSPLVIIWKLNYALYMLCVTENISFVMPKLRPGMDQ